MVVLINALAYDKGESGISSYMDAVLLSLKPDKKYFVVINKDDKDWFIHLKHLEFIQLPRILSKPLFSVLFSFFIFPFFALIYKADSVLLLAANRRISAYNFVKTIAVFHDLSQFHVPNKYGRLRMFYIKKVIPRFLKQCEYIHCISESTFNDILKYYQVPKSKLIVNYLGFTSTNPLENYSFRKEPRNILYVGRLESPGKNHIGLLRAYALLSKYQQEQYPLVFVGALWDGHENIYREIKHLDLESVVTIRGRVSRKALEYEYQMAKVFAFPSFYEGFGIPLLEAMDYGVPVVCSDISSLPEVGGDAVIKFNPHNPIEIKEAMLEVLEDKTKALKMVERGRKRILQFSWKRHVDRLLETCDVLL